MSILCEIKNIFYFPAPPAALAVCSARGQRRETHLRQWCEMRQAPVESLVSRSLDASLRGGACASGGGGEPSLLTCAAASPAAAQLRRALLR